MFLTGLSVFQPLINKVFLLDFSSSENKSQMYIYSCNVIILTNNTVFIISLFKNFDLLRMKVNIRVSLYVLLLEFVLI